MSYHEEVISTALLGTQKKTLQTQFLPEILAEIIKQMPSEDEEAKFFRAMALLQQYQKAGNLDVLIGLPELPIAQPEKQEYIDSKLQKALNILLNGEQHLNFFWEIFIDKCIVNQKIITPNMLVDFLEYMQNKPAYNHYIASLIGERGKWLAKLNPMWVNYQATPQKNEDLWDIKTMKLQNLLQFRQENPKKVREYIVAHWNDFSTSQRTNFVSVFRKNLSIDDEDALKYILEWIKAKKIEENQHLIALQKEVISCLLCIAESDLSKEVWAKFKNYLVIEKGKIQIKLPKKPDDFFNQEQMWQRLRLLEKSHNELWYNDMEGWAYEIFRHTSPKRLQEHFKLDITEILKQFNENETLKRTIKKHTLALYTKALAEAAFNFDNAAWAKAWIDYFKNIYKIEEQGVSSLFYLLEWKDIEEIYQNHISFSSPDLRDYLSVLTEHCDVQQWSEELSINTLQNLLLAASNHYINTTELQKIFPLLHPKAFEQISTKHPQENIGNWQQNNYSNEYRKLTVFKELTDLLM